MNTGFNALILDARFAALDELPAELYRPTLINPHGELLPRVSGVLRWRSSLLAGTLPAANEAGWPSPNFYQPLAAELDRLGLPRFCQGEAKLTDAVLLSILDAVSRGAMQFDAQTRDIAERLRREEVARRTEAALQRKLAEERSRTKGTQPNDGSGAQQRGGASGDRQAAGNRPNLPSESGGSAAAEELRLDAETQRRLLAEAQKLAEGLVSRDLTERLRAEWEERARLWFQLSEVFGELGQLLGQGWDLSRGVLRSQGWLEVMRLHELLKQLPALRDLIQMLGRMQAARPDAKSIMEEVFVSIRRTAEELREIRSPLVPMETRGVERSGDISRMLPSEAALLGHSVLKRLWHARRAERGLMSYRVEGTDYERVSIDSEGRERQQRQQKPQQRGPILVCVDTSGSMAGLPEQVAKALALEAMRVAQFEKRGLYLYLFSGPGQVAEHELSLSKDGLARLMALLSMSFHGGTDIAEPLVRAVQRLDESAWSRADILLVSDGEFGVPADASMRLKRAREHRGARVHGVLIGGGDSSAMRALCESDAVHRFTDWEDLAGLQRVATG